MAAKFQKLDTDFQHLLGEFNILKCKLECKTEALLILSHEQEQCRSEKDQYKLMADQLRERYSALKKRVEGWGPSLLGVYDVRGWKGEREQSLVQLLCELKEQNKSLQFEVDDLKQKLTDAQGDIRILREEMTRSRSGSLCDDVSSKQFPPYERESLVKQLEVFRHKYFQLERDLQAVLDEKEELVMARDAYRHKFERLNQQLNCLLRGDQHTSVDIDGVLMENRYLQERIKQVLEEKNMTMAALSKYKAMLEKKRSGGGLRLGSITAGLAISAKQVEQLLQNNSFLEMPNNSSNSTDFRNLIMTLLEALSDKTLALSHQRKTNKILGNRISELEQKVKTMEATSLWQFHDTSRLTYLLNMGQSEELQSIEDVSPQHSISSSISVPTAQNGLSSIPLEHQLDEEDSTMQTDDQCSLIEHSRANSSFSDLDLLPTKECSSKGCKYSRSGCTSSCASHFGDSKNSTPFQSPCHRRTSMHSDSEISPKKSLPRTTSTSSFHDNISSSTERKNSSSSDIDDLPPKLQKLLVAALAEIEEQSANQETNRKSPSHRSIPTKAEDPSC